uniref:DUF1618 domain-containing protein n=1 Tax=Leersia perrieri TaxID=77586 RepID=A0A0D9VZ45_9ORYZ
MAASRPPPSPPLPWILLDPFVHNYDFDIDPTAKGWEIVDCTRKEFCGAGKYGHLMADCLNLYMRLAENPLDHSELAVSADDEVVTNIMEGETTEQLPEDESSFPRLRQAHLDAIKLQPSRVTGYVQMADENLLVLSLSFPFTQMFRTMGCTTGDTIKIISISFDNYVPDAEKTVTEWMLDMATRRWIKVEEFSLETLWKLEDFEKYGLPFTGPLYPLLRKGEEESLYFILTNDLDDHAEHHMCRLDMRSMSLESTCLSWHPCLFTPWQMVGSEVITYLRSERVVPYHGKGKGKLDKD